MEERSQVIFVLGPPGCGKGTQCERLRKQLGCPFFSAGDLLRAQLKSGSKDGAMISELIAKGSIVPSQITMGLLKRAITEAKSKICLIDGFPRNHENYEAWIADVGDSMAIKFVLSLECSFEEMQRRILERGKESGRTDDNMEVLQNRYKTYQRETLPICAFFESRGMLRRIPEGTIVQVSQAIAELIK